MSFRVVESMVSFDLLTLLFLKIQDDNYLSFILRGRLLIFEARNCP